MTWTYVDGDGTNQVGSSTTVATPGCTVSVGDFVCVVVTWEGATTTVSVSDGTTSLTADSGGEYSAAGNEPRMRMFYLPASVASGTNSVVYTATFGAARAFTNIMAEVYTPPATVTVDAGGVGAGATSGTAVASGNITTTTVDGVAFGGYAEYGQVLNSAAINGVAAEQSVTPFRSKIWSVAYSTGYTGGATGTITSARWACGVIAFKAVASGTVVSASSGALTLTGQSVKLDSGVPAGGSSLVITGKTPIVTGGTLDVITDDASLIIAGQTPTITGATQIAVAGSASLVIAGQNISLNTAISNNSASLVITGNTPTVTGGTQTVSAGAASLVIDAKQVVVVAVTNTHIYARSASPYVYLSWDAEASATGYEIGYDTDTGDPYTNVLDVGNVTSYLLKPGDGYWYINIRSYDGVSSGAWGTEIEWESDGLYVTGKQVTLSTGISVGSASLVLTAQTQSLGSSISVPAASLAINGQQVSADATGNVWKDAGAASLVIDGQQAVSQTAENIVVDAMVASLVLTAQTPSIDFAIETASASLVIDAQQVGATATENIWKDAGAADLFIDGQQVNVTFGGSLIVEVDVAQLIITSFAPELSGADVEEVADQRQAVGSPSKRKYRRRRWVLPNGMHVFGTADQALEIAQSMLEQPVVIRQRRTQKPIVLHLDDGDIEALAIYPTQRASSSSSNDSLISQTQIAEPDWISAEQIMILLENRKLRRRKVAALLLLS